MLRMTMDDLERLPDQMDGCKAAWNPGAILRLATRVGWPVVLFLEKDGMRARMEAGQVRYLYETYKRMELCVQVG